MRELFADRVELGFGAIVLGALRGLIGGIPRQLVQIHSGEVPPLVLGQLSESEQILVE